MPDITVQAGDVSSGRFNLVAGQVSTVSFADDIPSVLIISDGTAAIYYTVDGRTPGLDSTKTYEIPAGTGQVTADKVTPFSPAAGGGDKVKLISSGTPSVRVERDD